MKALQSVWEKIKGVVGSIPQTPCLVFKQNPNDKSKMEHIGFYLGNGYVIHCSVEVKKQKLSDYKWTHFGVPYGLGGDVPVPTRPTIKRGSTGQYVVECQTALIRLGYDVGSTGADGKFGAKTESAVKQFQRDFGLSPVDGIVGSKTWSALDNAEQDFYTVTIHHVAKSVAESIVNLYGGTIQKEGE